MYSVINLLKNYPLVLVFEIETLPHIFTFRFRGAAGNMLTLASGTLVQNIVGSTVCLPKDYSTWKEFYQDQAAWPAKLTCRIYGCARKATVGAHVTISEHAGIYIIPMCAKHNNSGCTDEMPVNEGTVLVPVYEEDTCGPFNVCWL